jgi:hypothetical protein
VTAPFDVVAVVAELRAEVERRRSAGDYDERVLKALHEEFGADFNEPPEAVAYIASSRPLASGRPALGRVMVFGKRVMRRLLAWYVAPIADDQTRYNIAAIHLIRSLERRLAALEEAVDPGNAVADQRGGQSELPAAPVAAVAGLAERVDGLERRLDEVAGISDRG